MSGRALSIDILGMGKRFGAFQALDDVSLSVPAGSFHALLGENGAGKSTLVKCLMGFYQPDGGEILLDGKQVTIATPREARALAIGMVYQHFTLVPSLTGAENLVMARADVPLVVDWAKETKALNNFLDRMPFRVPLDVPLSSLAAGQKQKLEILKQLYLNQRFLILDEPTSVLTPDEATEILGLLRGMTQAGDLTVLMITHKFREVTEFCDGVTVLRRGKKVGGGLVSELSTDAMAKLMIGETQVPTRAARVDHGATPIAVDLIALYGDGDDGLPAVKELDLKVHAGEILGLAGVSGNGQVELLEILAGQRPLADGRIFVQGKPFTPKRAEMDLMKVFSLPEEPLKNATAPRMSVAENLAFRSFDKAPLAKARWFLSGKEIRAKAEGLIERYNIRTRSPETPMEALSGGNVQRAVLAREISGDVAVLVVANPCFGLDFASVADIRGQLLALRNKGTAILLISEDLDEILELSDRIAVMSEGHITYLAPAAESDRTAIGHAMAGH
jgi:simple sugar transport system ATP-binding protein